MDQLFIERFKNLTDEELYSALMEECPAHICEDQKIAKAALYNCVKPFVKPAGSGFISYLKKIDIMKTFYKNGIEDIQGYIYDYEILDENKVAFTFAVTNRKMRKMYDLFLRANFYEELAGNEEEVTTYIPKETINKHTVLNSIFRPYNYHLDCVLDIDVAVARGLLEEGPRYKCAYDKRFRFNVADLGPVYYNSHTERSEDIFDNALFEIRTTIVDQIDAIKQSIVDDNARYLGLGKLTFIDEEEQHDCAFSLDEIDAKEYIQIESAQACGKDVLDGLFEDYKKSDIVIHNVGSGNYLELTIHYNGAKVPNRLFLDAGYNFKNSKEARDEAMNRTVSSRDILARRITDADQNGYGIYFMVTHLHFDHYILFNALPWDLIDKMTVILPSYANKQKYKDEDNFTLFCKALIKDNMYEIDNGDSVRGTCIYTNSAGTVSLFCGKIDAADDLMVQTDCSSIMIQLKDTLLCGDCYFRNWPDGFGTRPYKHIVMPHHGFIRPEVKDDDITRYEAASDANSSFYISHMLFRNDKVTEHIDQLNGNVNYAPANFHRTCDIKGNYKFTDG